MAILGLIASTAMAAPTIKITGPGGVSTYQPAPGAVFQVDITITSDIGNMSAWGMNLSRPAGYGQGASLSAGRSYADFLDPDAFVWVNLAGWDTANAVGWAANAAGPVPMGTIWQDPAVGATSGWAAKVSLTAPTNPALLAGEVTGLGAYIGNMAGASFTPEVIPLTLTPEPISALLLLAGLPMLRRRR